MADANNEQAAAKTTQGGFRRRLVGTVRSNKMDKTVVVEVSRRFVDKKYKRYVKSRKRYMAHDADNEYFIGDEVEIRENRPFSKNKSWVVTRLVRASAERSRKS